MTHEIEFQKSEKGQIIVCRQGRILCSTRDPVKESKEWLKRQNLSNEDKKTLVLGLGAGYHIQELRSQFPTMQIDIVELDENLLNMKMYYKFDDKIQVLSKSDLAKQDLDKTQFKNYNAILAFRPAWQGYELQYAELYLNLTGRNRKSFLAQVESFGLISTASTIHNLPKELTFSIKTLNFLESDDSSFEVKMWKCLRELIE